MTGFFRNMGDMFVRDLTWNDFNRTFNEDFRGMYEFYKKNIKPEEGNKNRIKRTIRFLWFLFLAFLMKLTPPRRLMYAIALIFIIISYSQNQISAAVYSFIIVTILLAMELADKLITKDELSIAREIQLSLQPSGIKMLPGYEFSAHSEAAKEVGGDYYDVIKLPDESTLVLIGDVSGKGISSALYVVKTQTALQLFASETSDLRELLIRLNSYIYGQLKRNYFLSLFLAKLYPDGNVEYCRAGHPPALLYQASSNDVSWLKPNGFAVGMAVSSNNISPEQKLNTDFGHSLEIKNLRMQEKDLLFLFTDGVSESVSIDGKEYGQDRIAGLIKKNADKSMEVIKEHVKEELLSFRKGAELRDDTTFVLLRRS